jgi:hypothetical protein
VVVDAAANVQVIVLGINLSNPTRPGPPLLKFAPLMLPFLFYLHATRKTPAEDPLRAVFISGTWEQVRLFTSFLFLRIAAGSFLQAIVLNVSEEGDWRIGVLRSSGSLDLDGPNPDVKGGLKPKSKFQLNVSIALIAGGAVMILAAGIVVGVFVGLVKARDAFAA